MNNHLPTISICPIGGEQYVEFEDRTKRGHPIRVQYDYRHTDGILYSTIADDIEVARARRDAWLERRRTLRAIDPPSALVRQGELFKSAANANRWAAVSQMTAGEKNMADYSNFPFGDFTVAEIFALMRESKDIGDTDFVDACREAIRLNKCRPTQDAPDPETGAAKSDNESTLAVSGG